LFLPDTVQNSLPCKTTTSIIYCSFRDLLSLLMSNHNVWSVIGAQDLTPLKRGLAFVYSTCV